MGVDTSENRPKIDIAGLPHYTKRKEPWFPPGTVKLVSVCITVGVLAATVLSEQWRDAWSTWWAGKLPDSHQLWGRPTLFWSRSAKLLQFLAGLAVILDLIDPGKLKARGARATRLLSARRRRWLKVKNAVTLQELRTALYHMVMHRDGRRASLYDLPLVRLKNKPSRRLGRFRAEDLDEYADAVRQAAEAVFRDQMEVNRLVTRYRVRKLATEKVDSFLARHLSRTEIRYLPLAGRISHRLRWRMRFFLLSVSCVCFMILVLSDVEVGNLTPFKVFLAAIAVAAFEAAILLQSWTIMALGWVQLWRAVPSGLYLVAATILDKARPGHILRWLAFAFFVIGMHFDVLTS